MTKPQALELFPDHPLACSRQGDRTVRFSTLPWHCIAQALANLSTFSSGWFPVEKRSCLHVI